MDGWGLIGNRGLIALIGDHLVIPGVDWTRGADWIDWGPRMRPTSPSLRARQGGRRPGDDPKELQNTFGVPCNLLLIIDYFSGPPGSLASPLGLPGLPSIIAVASSQQRSSLTTILLSVLAAGRLAGFFAAAGFFFGGIAITA